MKPQPGGLVTPELVAVVVGVEAEVPRVLTTAAQEDLLRRLPSGPLSNEHRSMQAGVRDWVESQTRTRLGYVEQLYTFADRDRVSWTGAQVISVTYLALAQLPADLSPDVWLDWYDLYPWEDRRFGVTAAYQVLSEQVWTWASRHDAAQQLRTQVTFGMAGKPWLPELILQRYEVLYEAGLIPESPQFGDGPSPAVRLSPAVTGPRMLHDHRRILATGIARARAKIQYRPVVFELLPESFTLGQLQQSVEAIAGHTVHKQNFRRLVAQQELVEETGETTAATGGRPARLYRFRRSVIDERAATGTKLPRTR